MLIRQTRLMALVVLLVGLVAAPSAAQVFTGRIDITAVDSTGAVLPGATVEVTGPQNVVQVTDERGEAHFLGLPPGTYAVITKLQGFGDYENKNVPVVVGASV